MPERSAMLFFLSCPSRRGQPWTSMTRPTTSTFSAQTRRPTFPQPDPDAGSRMVGPASARPRAPGVPWPSPGTSVIPVGLWDIPRGYPSTRTTFEFSARFALGGFRCSVASRGKAPSPLGLGPRTGFLCSGQGRGGLEGGQGAFFPAVAGNLRFGAQSSFDFTAGSKNVHVASTDAIE